MYEYVAVQEGGVGTWSPTTRDQCFMILAHGDDRDIFVDEFESGDESIWSGFV